MFGISLKNGWYFQVTIAPKPDKYWVYYRSLYEQSSIEHDWANMKSALVDILPSVPSLEDAIYRYFDAYDY